MPAEPSSRFGLHQAGQHAGFEPFTDTAEFSQTPPPSSLGHPPWRGATAPNESGQNWGRPSALHRGGSRRPAPDGRPEAPIRVDGQQAVVGVLLGVGALVIISVLVLALTGRMGGDSTANGEAAGASGAAMSPDPALDLPIAVEDVGFGQATIQLARPGEGPDGVTLCNRRPDIDGLQRWAGNRITDQESQVRVAQTVAEFATDEEASQYVSSVRQMADCGNWEIEGTDAVLRFVGAPATPNPELSALASHPNRHLELSEMQATADGRVPIYMRSAYLQHETTVLHIVVISLRQSELDVLDKLVATGAAKVG